MRAATVTILLSLAVPVSAQDLHGVLSGGLIAANTLDIYTTHRALQHNGVREGNPVIRSWGTHPVKLSLIKAGSTGATIYVTRRFWREGRKKLAIGILLVSVGSMTWVAHHNYRMGF